MAAAMTATVDRSAEGPKSTHHEVAIVGAGFGGMGVAIELERIGIYDFVILEQADDLGGTWRDNTYPGLEVDIPSFSYSYAFEPADWSQVYAPGREVKQYADRCARKYGLLPHIRFNTKVTEIRWDDAAHLWRISVEGGEELTARYFVSATGYLVSPQLPDIEGIESFGGKLMHTGRWDHDYDLEGKRVAMIGTGATAIQVAPAIVDQLTHLDVFQRRAIWLAPKPNFVYSERTRKLLRRAPVLQGALRSLNWWASELFFSTGFVNHKRFPGMFEKIEEWLVNYIRREVDDPETQEKLIPDYSFFCKRPSFSNEFYPMFNRDNVELITEPITRVCENGILTEDGVLHEVDTIICATGYKVFDRTSTPTFEVFGKGGKNLGDWWEENRYQAYLGTTIPDFPNYFIIVGPYAASGASYFDVLRNQVVHISRCLRTARKRHADYIEVKTSAHERDFAAVQKRAQNTVLFNGNCESSNSYYFDKKGDTPGGPRPATPTEHWLKARLFPMSNYVIEPTGGNGRPVSEESRTAPASR